MKSGKLNFLEPSRPLQDCNGTDLLLVVSTSPQPRSCRTTPCRLSVTAYSIYSQLPSILEVVTPSVTWGRAIPWWQGPTYHGLNRHDVFMYSQTVRRFFPLKYPLWVRLRKDNTNLYFYPTMYTGRWLGLFVMQFPVDQCLNSDTTSWDLGGDSIWLNKLSNFHVKLWTHFTRYTKW